MGERADIAIRQARFKASKVKGNGGERIETRREMLGSILMFENPQRRDTPQPTQLQGRTEDHTRHWRKERPLGLASAADR